MPRAGDRIKQLEATLTAIEKNKKSTTTKTKKDKVVRPKCTKKDCEHKTCPMGMIVRNAYDRKAYTKASGVKVGKTHVAESCIANRGKPGKAMSKAEKITVPMEGMLENLGYHASMSEMTRHQLLGKAIKKHGAMDVKQHLNARANQLMRTSPKASAAMRADYEWVMATYMKGKNMKGGAESEGATFMHPSFFQSTSPSSNIETATAGFGMRPLEYSSAGPMHPRMGDLSFGERQATFMGDVSTSREIPSTFQEGAGRRRRRVTRK